MESAEHSPEQPRKQNESVDKAKSGLTNLTKQENLQQSLFSNQPLSKSYISLEDQQKLQPDPVGEIPNVSDEQGILNQQAGQTQDVFHQKGPERPERGAKDFIWTEDLSENGQKLYLILLGDVGHTNELPKMAKIESIDLDAGLKELRNHNILDESDPTIILLNIKKR